MSESTMMTEFLVGLGFKIDEKGLKSFTSGIEGATKAVTKMVTVVSGASLTMAAGVAAFAANLEGLYFASQRVGASASNIKSMEYAARDLGASAGEARGSLESVARFMRNNPGGESFIRTLGVQTRDVQGNLRDTTDLLIDLGKGLRDKPWYVARQYGELLGIDDKTLKAIMDGSFARKVEDNRRVFADMGVGQKQVDGAHKFMENLRSIGMQFDALSILVQGELNNSLGPALNEFSKWFEKNGPEISKDVAEMGKSFVEFARDDAGPAMKALLDYLKELHETTDGWSTKLLGAIILARALGATSLISGILKLAAAFVNLGAGIAGAGAAAGAAGAGAGAGAAAGRGLLGRLAISFGPAAAAALAMFYSPDLNEGEEKEVKRIRQEKGLPEQEPETPKLNALAQAWKTLQGVDQDKATFALDFFKTQGWTHEQASGLVANLVAESNLDPKAKGDWNMFGPQAHGIAQWHPDRQQAFKEWAGFTLGDSRADFMKQLEFVQYELTQGAELKAGRLLRAAQNAESAGRVVSDYYERPYDKDGSKAAQRGAMASQISQSNTFHVYGATDPETTGREIEKVQGRANEDLARNIGGRVQ